MRLARINEVLPLNCPICHSQMRVIAFINDTGAVKKILDQIGESTQPPRIALARGPPLWEAVAEPAWNNPQRASAGLSVNRDASRPESDD
jgi:hypothetical protein